MLTKIKKQFYQLLKDLGYEVTDNGTYKENFPWLMIRTGGYQSAVSLDVRYDVVTIILDIFSQYNGEQEIINISENIIQHLQDLRESCPEITVAGQSAMVILGDKQTGPVRKHGVLTYRFVLTSGIKEEEEDETTDTAGD